MASLLETLRKEEPVIKKVSSGLTTVIWPFPGFQKKYGLFSTPFGSTNNRVKIADEICEIPEGAAHFLEHKIFAEETGENVFNKFAAIGASCNAFTSLHSTNYLFSTWEHLDVCLNLMLNFVQNLYLTEEGLEKEKKVILQEIKMYRDHPEWRAFFNLLQGLYHNHPIRNDIAGTEESVLSIDREIIEFCYETFYHPGNMVFILLGDLDPARVLELIEDNQSRRKFPADREFSFLPVPEPEHVNRRESREYLSISQPIVHLGFRAVEHPCTGLGLLKRELIYALLLDIILGSGSPAFYELYDEGLVDDGFSTSFSGEKSFGHMIMGGRTSNPEELRKRLLKIIEKVKDEGLDIQDLERAKKKLWGSFISGLNSLEVLAGQFIKDCRRGVKLSHHFLQLEKVETGDLMEVLERDIVEERSSFSIVEPFTEDE